MRTAFILSYLANVILVIACSAILPDRVAIHFGLGGNPDAWATNLTSTLILLAMHTFVFVSLYFSPGLLEKVPARWISLPNRGFWLRPEHRAEAMERFSRHLWRFGIALFLFMLLTGFLVLKANLSDPFRLDEGPLMMALVIFLVYTVYWTIALLRAFRISPHD